MNQFPQRFLFLSLTSFLILLHKISASNDTLSTSQLIRDGQTLSSSGGNFQLGFFSPGNSTRRYVGIWYKNIPVQTVVWVANRESPLRTTSGVLTVTQAGILALLDGPNGVTIWSSNTTRPVGNPTARLLDSGNLVVKDADDDTLVWQSFDYPTDTFIAGIKMGWDYVSGVETHTSSWRSEDDPAKGEYSSHVDPTGYPQMVIKKGGSVQHRIGPWNGLRWSGAPDTSNDPTYKVMLWMNKKEVRYMEVYNESVISRSILRPDGIGQRLTWNSRTSTWTSYTDTPVDICDSYGLCGLHGSCTAGDSPNCACLDRFVPRDQERWNRTDWSSGCVRRTPPNCSDDVFLKYSGIKLPDSRNSTYNDQILSLEECRGECSRNCSCSAYTQLNISGSGSGCLFYHGGLIDIRTMAQAGQDLYIRMASSEAPTDSIVAGPFSGNHAVRDLDLPFFSLSKIMQATDNFSDGNKLGEGGFGPVYKGMLEDGQEVAVKRLSESSTQGVDELRNEVVLIAKLQHRNLVRTLGCCVEGEENMLIYEFVPNSSLDLILFGYQWNCKGIIISPSRFKAENYPSRP